MPSLSCRPTLASVIGRRDLLKLGAAAFAGLPLEHALPTCPLGRTGHAVKIFSLGGQAALEHPDNQDVAVPLIERGSRPWSEHCLGLVMKRRRAEAFLATATAPAGCWASPFELLQTDHLDLWQRHNLQTMDEVEQIFAKDGAIEALLQSRKQKLVRFLGVTRHADPDDLIATIQRFPFDTILLALNAADHHHLSFADRLLPLAVSRRMGVIGMKIRARRTSAVRRAAGTRGPAAATRATRRTAGRAFAPACRPPAPALR